MVVVAGSADRLLPSVDEAERLKNLIPGCRSMVLEGHGHAPLFDGRVDMSEIIAGDPALEGVVFPEGDAEVGLTVQLHEGAVSWSDFPLISGISWERLVGTVFPPLSLSVGRYRGWTGWKSASAPTVMSSSRIRPPIFKRRALLIRVAR